MSNENFIPSEGIPTWEFIADELEARGWTRQDMADRMGGDVSVNLCVLEFLEHLPYHPAMSMGQETAERIGSAFGTDAQVWLNIEASYYRWCAANPTAPEVAGVLEHIRNRFPPPPAGAGVAE